MSEKKVLVCSYHVVQPDRDSGARRVFHLMSFLQEAGWTVTFLAADGAGDVRDVRRLEQLGIAVYDGVTDSVESLLSAECFDLAVIAFWRNAERYLPLLRKLSPATRVIVDSIDLHFLREARGIFCGPSAGAGSRLLDNKFGLQFVAEMNAYAAVDAVLTVSQKEADLVNDMICDPGLAHAVPLSEDLKPSPIPFEERRGIVCVGSFQHPPNVQAVRYLCSEILPKIDSAELAHHPVYIVGNALDEKVCSFGHGLPSVRMVGWVPSVVPYLERARVSVVPLLFGAGTKGKLVQALMVGTPTVSTRIGVEGLDLHDGQHVLVADTPVKFAESITRLLKDKELWNQLSVTGREYITETHSMDMARERFRAAVDRVMASSTKTTIDSYQQLVPRIRKVACSNVPPDATVLVVSKGDNELLKLNGCRAGHFPQTDDGTYAGFYPKDSVQAIAHLDSLRQKGANYLLFPRTAFWWLDHYVGLKTHLESHHTLVCRDELCVVYRLGQEPDKRLPEPGASVRHPATGLQPSGTKERIGSNVTAVPRNRDSFPISDPADVRLIALYLPQFHPIPENDAWWGEGFTEWRNVAKATPQFPGHYQPHVPADLGFYDLRLPETREEQAALARKHGIHGFCYYHYWFSGKRLLERPFNEVLASGQPDFPFCLCWANDPWSRRWDGREDELLQAQTYSDADDINHIRALIPAFSDRRAITLDGKPIFLVYRAKHLPEPRRTTSRWRKEIKKAGLKGLYLIAVETPWDFGWDATQVGFDAKVLFQPQFGLLMTHATKNGARIEIPGKDKLQVYAYQKAREALAPVIGSASYRRYETVYPGWDNTARVGEKAVVMHNSSPEAYEEWLRGAVERARTYPPGQRLVFINAWNEWAEGCHLEPDLRHGHAYLEATQRALQNASTPATAKHDRTLQLA